MSEYKELKDPTPDMIGAGVHLEQYTRIGIEHLIGAFECIDASVRQAKKLGGDIDLLDLVEERQMIIDQIRVTLDAQKLHKKLSDRLEVAGYRKITDDDFLKKIASDKKKLGDKKRSGDNKRSGGNR